MQTKVSAKGQTVLPGPLRQQLGIRAGDPLEAIVEAGSIVLTPRKRTPRTAKIVIDPLTGLPVLSLGGNSPVLRSKDVEESLSKFP